MFGQSIQLSIKAIRTKQETIENLEKTEDYKTFRAKHKWDLLGKSVSLDKIREKEEEFGETGDLQVSVDFYKKCKILSKLRACIDEHINDDNDDN